VDANASLGLCFEKGRGVVQSSVEAERLYKLAAKSGSSIWAAFPVAQTQLLKESPLPNASPETPSAVARARIQFALYHLNVSSRQGHAAADEELKTLVGRRDMVSACCVGCGAVRQLKICGAVRKLKICSGCRVTRLCDTECAARVWPAHKASCKVWRAELATRAEQG
jgi:hypothetical protein